MFKKQVVCPLIFDLIWGTILSTLISKFWTKFTFVLINLSCNFPHFVAVKLVFFSSIKKDWSRNNSSISWCIRYSWPLAKQTYTIIDWVVGTCVLPTRPPIYNISKYFNLQKHLHHPGRSSRTLIESSYKTGRKMIWPTLNLPVSFDSTFNSLAKYVKCA